MLTQKKVDSWLKEFTEKNIKVFGKNLVLVDHHGSWARGEAAPTSDIDTMVVLRKITTPDLEKYRKLINSMPHAAEVARGVFISIKELKAWPRKDLIQFFFGGKHLYGSIKGIIKPPGKKDFIADIKYKATENNFNARHYLLFPHDHAKAAFRLYYPYKQMYYALQSLVYVKKKVFIKTKNELLKVIKDRDYKECIIVTRDWKKLAKKPAHNYTHYIELLERATRKLLDEVESL